MDRKKLSTKLSLINLNFKVPLLVTNIPSSFVSNSGEFDSDDVINEIPRGRFSDGRIQLEISLIVSVSIDKAASASTKRKKLTYRKSIYNSIV